MSTSQTGDRFDISEFIDSSKLSRLQWTVFTLCFVAMFMDGYDVQALGYVAPTLIDEWGLPNAALGPVFGAGNFGVLIGSLLLSMAADRFGRRPVFVGATLFFSVMTIITARANGVQELLIYRFIAGIGLGAMPAQATALVGEYSPARLRVTLIMVSTLGFTVGAAFGGVIAAALIPTYGWQSVLYFGGITPLFIGVIMLVALPESLQLMVLRGKSRHRLVRWLKMIDPTAAVSGQTEFVVPEENRAGFPLLHLFREGRARTTLLLWTVNFMNLLTIYSLASWLPTVVTDAGYSTRTAVLVGSVLQVGGIFGTLVLAWLASRHRLLSVLGIVFATAGVSIALIGQPILSLALLFLVVFVSGWCIVGSQPGLNVLSAGYYPTSVRATGIGAGLGIGRIGAIVGPIIGGQFMALRWSNEELFLAAAVPTLISTVVIIGLHWTMRGPRS